jgi:hypothetical protein
VSASEGISTDSDEFLVREINIIEKYKNEGIMSRKIIKVPRVSGSGCGIPQVEARGYRWVTHGLYKSDPFKFRGLASVAFGGLAKTRWMKMTRGQSQ